MGGFSRSTGGFDESSPDISIAGSGFPSNLGLCLQKTNQHDEIVETHRSVITASSPHNLLILRK
jgi:hypothetical protein